MPVAITSTQMEFIFDNKDKMKQTDIAKAIKVTPACVCKILRPKTKVVIMEHYFDIDKEYKMCYGV